jgi:hypothetical protein
MRLTQKLSLMLGLLLAVGLCVQPPALAQTGGKDSAKKSGTEKKEKKDRSGTPVLWRDHTDVAGLDLFNGPGGAEMQPDLSSLTFIREETGGYSKKYRVRDAKGRVWVAKIGKEAQAETAATRLVWAAGYVTEITYLAPRATIEGKGAFENVRFEARPEEVDRLDEWKWAQNPFAGTREMQGLKVLMAFIENWDLKDANNKVLWAPGANGNELRYVVSDLGATFGKTGGQNSPMAFFRSIKGSRNEPDDYAGDKFVEGIEGGNVKLHFSGKNSSLMRGISVADAKWVGQLLARLSDRQIEDAFRAANYGPEDVRLLTQAVRTRINELTSLP